MTRKQQKRKIEIIKILSDMSRDWSKWTCADWQPLEKELDSLNGRR